VKRILVALTLIIAGAALVFSSSPGPTFPNRVSLGTLANLYAPVELDHAAHAEIAGDCASCHHQPFGEPEPCASCHNDQVALSAFVHELHWQVEACTACHRRSAAGELRCVSCHSIEPDPERLEVIGLKGAYHGLCLRCHGETGSDESCSVCHPDR
jgi:hypothetical protein